MSVPNFRCNPRPAVLNLPCVKPCMNSLFKEHLGYLSTRNRLDIYRRAIEQTVRDGDTVLDLGCGTGVLGLLCLEAGAAQVVAVDSTAALQIAQLTLDKAGWAGHVEFILANSYQSELPHRVDLVICDHIGYFGFDYGLISVLADAKRRFLKPSGTMIPRRLKLQLAAVESENCQKHVNGWQAEGIPYPFHWLTQHSVNSTHPVTLTQNELLSKPTDLAIIDLYADNPDFFSWSAQTTVIRNGTVHGLVGWFDCELAESIWMTNSPLSAASIDRSQAFLPISEALPVQAGDVLNVTIMARPDDSLIAWTVEHPASGKRFSHSTWQGELIDRAALARSHPDYIPRLSRSANARNTVLSYCDGKHSIAQVQQAVLRDHPALFPTPAEISRFVAAVLRRDTQ